MANHRFPSLIAFKMLQGWVDQGTGFTQWGTGCIRGGRVALETGFSGDGCRVVHVDSLF